MKSTHVIKAQKKSAKAGTCRELITLMIFLIIYPDISIEISAPEDEGQALKVEKKDI